MGLINILITFLVYGNNVTEFKTVTNKLDIFNEFTRYKHLAYPN